MEKQKEGYAIDWQALAGQWMARYLQRTDLFALQLNNGRYACIKTPVHTRLMVLHLRGQLTLGGYLLDPQSRVRQVIFDADDEERFDHLKHLAEALAFHGMPSYLETSRRGGHLRLFSRRPSPAGPRASLASS